MDFGWISNIVGKACKAAGIVGVTGCTEAEIATITGHPLRSVRAILDTHNLSRDPGLAENAIRT